MNTSGQPITKYHRAPDTSLRNYVRPVLERKWIVLLTVLSALGTTFAALRMSLPVYQAQVTMIRTELIGNPSLVFLDPYAQRSRIESSYDSIIGHMEILRSALSLEKIQERLKKEYNLEFTAGQILAAFSLKSQVGSPIIKLTATADTPERAQALANTTAEVYIQQVNDIKKADLSQGLTFLEQQMVSVNQKLTAAEKTLNQLKIKNKTFTPEKDSSSARSSDKIVNQLQELESEVSKAQIDIGWTEGQLESVQNSIREAEMAPSSSFSSEIEPIQSKLVELQLTLDSMRGNFTEKAPEVVSVKRQIGVLQERLDSESAKRRNNAPNTINSLSELQSLRQQAVSLDVNLRGLKQKEGLFKQQISTFKAQHPNLMTEQMQLTSLERQTRVHEQTYLMLLEKYEEMSLAKEMEMSRLQILDKASLPIYPTGLSGKMLLPLSGMLGLGLGVGIAFFLEYLDDSIKRKEDVEKYLALPTIGVIPKMKPFKVPTKMLVERERTDLKQTQQLLSHILLFNQSTVVGGNGIGKSAVETSYQTLAALIGHTSGNTPPKTLLITSAVPDEGKTTIATNLAICLAQTGKKVLLIDTDLKADRIRRIFQQDASPGLTDFWIDEEKPLDDFLYRASFIRSTSVENLSILPVGGADVESPEKFLSSERMGQFIQRLKEVYDIILFDSAPLLVAADTMILTTHVDATLLVIKSGTTKRQIALEATEILHQIHAEISGVVLNAVGNPRRYGPSS